MIPINDIGTDAYAVDSYTPVASGITLTLYPSDLAYDHELQRADDNGSNAPNTSTWATIAVYPASSLVGSGMQVYDMLPNNGSKYWYRWRDVKDQYTAGGWSTAVSAISRQIDKSRLAPTVTPISAYSAQTTDSTGLILVSGINDSRSYPVNNMLATSYQDISDVSDGGGYAKTTSNQVTGAGRAYSAIDSGNVLVPGSLDFTRAYLNKNGAYLARNGSDTTPINDIVARLDSSGNAASSMTDNRGYPVNNMFATSYQDISAVSDGGGYYKANLNQITGAGRAYSSLDGSGILLTGLDGGGTIAGRPASLVALGGDVTFREQFDVLPNWPDGGDGVGSQTLVGPYPGTTGPNVLQIVGQGSGRYPQRIALNPSTLYRCRARVRITTDPTIGSNPTRVYFGLYQYDGYGVALGIPAAYQLAQSVALAAADGWRTFEVWMQGVAAGTGVGTGGGTQTAPGTMHYQCASFSPIWTVNYLGSDSVAQIDYIEVIGFDEDASSRVYGAIRSDTNLNSTTLAMNGTMARQIASGRIRETGFLNGGSSSFIGNVPNAPMITVTGGVSYEPGSVWGDASQADGNVGAGGLAPLSSRQVDEVYAYNITLSGYFIRARLRQLGGAVTSRTDSSWSPTSISAIGTGTVITSANAPAYNDSYTADFTYDFTRGNSTAHATSISATVSLDYYNGSSWVSTTTATFSNSDDGLLNGGIGQSQASGSYTLVGSVASRNSSSQFRLVITSATATGGGSTVLALVPSTLTYTTTAADQYATKTPSGITATVDITGAS